MGTNIKLSPDKIFWRTSKIEAARGVIYDASGKQLVQNDPAYAVYIQPQKFKALSASNQTQLLGSLIFFIGNEL